MISELLTNIYNALVYYTISSKMVGTYVDILNSIFIGMITTLTIITAVISFTKPKRDKYIEKQLKKFDEYACAITGEEKKRQVYDRYSALKNIYLKYIDAYNDIQKFDNLLDMLKKVFVVSGITAWIAVGLSLISIHIWWLIGGLLFLLITVFLYIMVRFLIGFINSCKINNYYPNPEDLLNPMNELESKTLLKLGIDEDFVQNLFFYGLAIRVNSLDNLNKLKLKESEKECTHYLNIYSFLPYKINEITITCEFSRGYPHSEKIYNFAEMTKSEKSKVSCLLHTIEKMMTPVRIEVCIQKNDDIRITHEFRQHTEYNDGCYYPTGITIITSNGFESDSILHFAKSERVIR